MHEGGKDTRLLQLPIISFRPVCIPVSGRNLFLIWFRLWALTGILGSLRNLCHRWAGGLGSGLAGGLVLWMVGRLPVSLLGGSLPGGGLGAWRAACFADGPAFWLCRLAGRLATWAVLGLALGSLAGLLLWLLAGLHAGLWVLHLDSLYFLNW